MGLCFKYYDEGEVGLSFGSGFGIGGRGRPKIKNYVNYYCHYYYYKVICLIFSYFCIVVDVHMHLEYFDNICRDVYDYGGDGDHFYGHDRDHDPNHHYWNLHPMIHQTHEVYDRYNKLYCAGKVNK